MNLKPITDSAAFYNREYEKQKIKAHLLGGQNCQIFGGWKTGKSSLLRQAVSESKGWDAGFVAGYVNLLMAPGRTQADWLHAVGRILGMSQPFAGLSAFERAVEELRRDERRLVLCLDRFDEMIKRPEEFTHEFYASLEGACCDHSLSIVTASPRSMRESIEPSGKEPHPVLGFAGTFAPIQLAPFSEYHASGFIGPDRPGSAAFTSDDRAGILCFAKGHPLLLQVACYHVLEGKRTGLTIADAISLAAQHLQQISPNWLTEVAS